MSNIKCEDFISTPVIREKCIKYKPDVFAQRIEQILGKLPREVASKILSHLEKKRLLAIDEDPFVGDYVIVETCEYTYVPKVRVPVGVIADVADKLTPSELMTLLLVTDVADLIRDTRPFEGTHLFVVDRETGTVYRCKYDKYYNVVECSELSSEDYKFIAVNNRAVLIRITRYVTCSKKEIDVTEFDVVRMINGKRYTVYMCKMRKTALEYRESEPDINKIRELLERGEDVIRYEKVCGKDKVPTRDGGWREEQWCTEIPQLAV